MSQNISTAVMARRTEPADSLDYFPTPPWATRALCELLGARPNGTVWEPACGAGHMARPLAEYWGRVVATDVAADQIGYGQRLDFLLEPRPADVPAGKLDAIITNPPFRLAAAFVRHALPQAAVVAMLVRTAFLEGGERWRDLFDPYPPTTIAQFAERVPMHKGRCLRAASTATAYCWIVWRHDPHRIGGTDFRWIPPGTRKRLERPGDYDDDVVDVGAGAA
ncbi:class I SAM-dependent methyltransferase [Roseospira marina]|uniref:Class I SAM-dependent methyltransferase n=1 Tax=Roseospira marina TaxID=140057 RepID=A0A5M6I462_9PROT|nr:class I SAM-dependent methyltransferase [Roseospira marina]KAA5603004.1 class I SAM-dependent methyltransferase [Roseospira marina]MBB4313033.1 hypothetical protein [Roseospira marina]MBB5089296.1 hypothetical protein [Roseospira marina]